MKTFSLKVREVVRAIPYGKVMTYAAVASKAGNSKASRAVGSVMRNNFDVGIPCHRVVCSDGKIGDYNRGGMKKKIQILKKEGIRIGKNGFIE